MVIGDHLWQLYICKTYCGSCPTDAPWVECAPGFCEDGRCLEVEGTAGDCRGRPSGLPSHPIALIPAAPDALRRTDFWDTLGLRTTQPLVPQWGLTDSGKFERFRAVLNSRLPPGCPATLATVWPRRFVLPCSDMGVL